MKITGERVVTPTGGFNPTWQRHAAAYDACAPRLGPGRVLDLGCGVGHSYHRLAPRETVGVDVEPEALVGQDRETVVADMRDLPFEDASFSSIVAVHSLEHVPDPERTIAEAARVLEGDGIAAFVTPNRLTLGLPDEIIDPYHFVEFDADELRSLCRGSFGEVEVLGVFGSDRYMELFDEERETLAQLLRRDPLRLRRLVPRRGRQLLYDGLLRRHRPGVDPRAEAIGVEDFELREDNLADALDLVAFCRLPLGGSHAGAEVRGSSPPNCVWCGAPLDRTADRLRGRTRCRSCGAATTDPWPAPHELERAYGSWYWPDSGRRFLFGGDAVLRRSRASLAGRLDEIAPPGGVLDVGAGEGVLIDALRRRGRVVHGLEREAKRPEMSDDPLEAIEGEWAAVVFWHSLEHLPAPGDAIRESARLLRPGGVLIVAVPNTDSLQARTFGDRWLHLDLPRHLVHLSKRALLDRLVQSGFTVERVSQVRGGQIVIGWLEGLVGMLPGGLAPYQALRRSDARSEPISAGRRLAAVVASAVMLPVAAACTAAEVALRRSGTIYVEARLG